MHALDDCPITDCPAHETCSHCTTLVLDSSLKELPRTGERLCPDCYKPAMLHRMQTDYYY